jgi:hypothetical protein
MIKKICHGHSLNNLNSPGSFRLQLERQAGRGHRGRGHRGIRPMVYILRPLAIIWTTPSPAGAARHACGEAAARCRGKCSSCDS